MIELNVAQGSPEWHAARAKCHTASEAPAMMGVGKSCTRTELLNMKKTGIAPDVNEWVQRFLFDKGHEFEAAARPIAERIIDDDLFPIVATDDSGKYLASADGATMFFDVGFEHKMWNAELAASVADGVVPEHHRWQLDQLCMVFGFERILFVVSDGTEDHFAHCWYSTTPERVEALKAGWAQFDADLAEHEYVAPEQKPVGHAPEALPALLIEVSGMVTASNLDAFKAHALAVFSEIKTDLQSDADFADAEKTVKWCKDVEDKLDGAKQHALSQTASIDKLFSTIDAIKEEARAVRLKLDKLVKSEKESRKAEIVAAAHRAFSDHLASLMKRTGVTIPAVGTFGEAIRGLKSLDSMRDKVGAALAAAKIETSAIADRIDANRKTVEDMTLFPDFSTVCMKAPDDFAALLAVRINARKEAEEKRIEAERARIRAEEQVKAQREAQEAARAEAEKAAAAIVKPDPAPVAVAVTKPAEVQQIEPAQADSGKRITLGQINAVLAPISITAAGLASIGFEPVGRERAAVLYREADVSRICAALVRHLQATVGQMRAAA